MKKFQISQTDTVVYLYEVEAEDVDEAITKVRNEDDDVVHLPEYDDIIDRMYQEEV